MSCSSSHSINWSPNPSENMFQLLIHPDSVFYVLLRESLQDDIINKPQSPRHHEKASGINSSNSSTPPFCLIDKGGGSGVANKAAEWADLPVKGQRVKR